MLNTFWVHQKKRENEKFYQNALVKLCILMMENELTFFGCQASDQGWDLAYSFYLEIGCYDQILLIVCICIHHSTSNLGFAEIKWHNTICQIRFVRIFWSCHRLFLVFSMYSDYTVHIAMNLNFPWSFFELDVCFSTKITKCS